VILLIGSSPNAGYRWSGRSARSSRACSPRSRAPAARRPSRPGSSPSSSHGVARRPAPETVSKRPRFGLVGCRGGEPEFLAGQWVDSGVDQHLEGVAALTDMPARTTGADLLGHTRSLAGDRLGDSDPLIGSSKTYFCWSAWWRRRESNPQPPPCKGGALPIELRPPTERDDTRSARAATLSRWWPCATGPSPSETRGPWRKQPRLR
jgi:hypothetical protein